MRAWLVDQFGEPQGLRLGEVPLPEPGPGQVRVKVLAAAINFFDLLLVQGKYQAKPAFPFTPGAEGAGLVDKLGEGVTGVELGESVIVLPEAGCYAEFVIARSDRVLGVPAGLSLAQAAAMPIVYQTAWFALVDRAGLCVDEWLLVHAGASGTGMAAIQIGKALGARVIATAGSEPKLDFCARQGADHTLLYTDPAWVERVKEITGDGAGVIYDPVGGDVFDLSTKCIAPGGRLLVIGFASGRIPSIAANRILLKNISIVGAVWGGWVARDAGYLRATHARLTELIDAGKLRPAVTKEYGFEDAATALRDVAGRAMVGKSVLRIS